jgi:hypothetical protein
MLRIVTGSAEYPRGLSIHFDVPYRAYVFYNVQLKSPVRIDRVSPSARREKKLGEFSFV